MMIKYGIIREIDAFERIVIIETRKRIRTLYLPRSLFHQFDNFFMPGNSIVYTTRPPRSLKHQYHDNVKDVIKIIKPHRPKPKVLYSHQNIKSQMKDFINTLGAKMYLDIEMSMHPYTVDKSFTQEIIQVGYILVDHQDNVIEHYKAFIKPKLHQTLTRRTLKFLDLTQNDIDEGISFIDFYNHFKQQLENYNPAIIVWGKNDEMAIQDAIKIHHLNAFSKPLRYINLLKLHKTYYRLKDDLGLLNAYKLYGGNSESQRHDALDDANMTKFIFENFARVVNKTQALPRLEKF